MSKRNRYKVQRAGAYVVKAAESPSSRVNSKSGSYAKRSAATGSVSHAPSANDRRIAQAVIRHKSH